MGADFIAWRGCPLQEDLGPDGFLGKLKLRAYRKVIEERVPKQKWAETKLKVMVSNKETRMLSHPEIVEQLQAFTKGIPECPACAVSGGKPLGCYRYLTYPIDAVFERLLFELFVMQISTKDSIARQVYDDIVSALAEGDGFYEPRGGPMMLAELPEPLVHEWKEGRRKRRFDSAQLLRAATIPLDDGPKVVAYNLLWSELLEFAAKKKVRSRNLEEIREIRDLLLFTVAGALTDGWQVVVDG
jgi:hypothetical protein